MAGDTMNDKRTYNAYCPMCLIDNGKKKKGENVKCVRCGHYFKN